jgi:transcription elongation GreA/GreB family factor
VIDEASGGAQTYHILGAWDGDPARNILSYPAALAQALLDRKPGDTVSAKDDTGTRTLRIDRIERVPAEVLQAL